MKYIGLIILFALLVITAKSQLAQAHSHKILVGAEISYPPYSFTDSLGQPTGYSVELFRAAASAVNIEVTFKNGVWKELKKLLASGQIDALPLVGQNQERAKVFDFTTPYLELSGCIVVNKAKKHIKTVEQLKHSCVLVMEGDNAHEYLLKHADKPNIKTTDTYVTALKLLAAGECDAVVMQKLLAHQLIDELELSTLTISNTLSDFRRQFSFALKKGNAHLLEQLNIGLRIVSENGTQRQLESKWLSTTKDIALRKRTLIVGGDASYPPMEYIDEDGNPAGFNVDLIKAVARQAGLSIRIELGLWSSVTQKLANGEIDIIQGMHYSHERDVLYDFSSPSAFLGQVVMCRKDSNLPHNIDELRGKKIVVQEEDINHQFLLRNGFKEELKTVASQELALEMVSKKIADYTLVSRFTATNIMQRKSWNLHASQEALFYSENSIAVQEGNHALLATLSEALQAIKVSGEYRKIYNKHLGVHDDKQQAMRRLYNRIYWIVGVSLALIIIVLIWTNTLRRMVGKRTLELREANHEYESLNEELRQNNEELELAKERAEESDKLKSAFLSNMSHEIRTPMNGIIGFSDLLQKPNLSPQKQERYRDVIQSSGKQLLNIVNDVLDISKIETNQMNVRYDDVDLKTIIDNTVKLHLGAARKKNIRIEAVCQVANLIKTDPTKLAQIINNLVSNAVKYTNEGHIDIRCKRKNGKILISVSDTGIGIEEKMQPKVFDRFIQAETGYTRNHGGAGLGLSITKSFVELLGGTIGFESESGKGTTFLVELPIM